MRRQENYHRSIENEGILVCVKTDGLQVFARYPIEYQWLIKLFHWAHKGKNGIVNDMNVSLAAMLADRYGFTETNWRRIEQNDDYNKTNFTVKIGSDLANCGHKTVLNGPKNRKTTQFFPHKRWKTKLECENLELTVVTGTANSTVVGKITIRTNVFLRKYVPLTIKYVDEDLVIPGSDEKLSVALLKAAGAESINGTWPSSWGRRRDKFDFTMDPNNVTYTTTPYTHTRRHYITINEDGVDCDVCVIEYRERHNIDCLFKSWPHANMDEQFRIPMTYAGGKACPGRTSFVMLDADVAEGVDGVYLDGYSGEFMAYTDKDPEKAMLLKRYVAERNGISTTNIYVPPVMTQRYKTAYENSGDKGKFDRRRWEYENGTSEDGKKAFTDPKHIKFRRVVAKKLFFVTQIYDGVGVWVRDMRKVSLHVKVSTNDIRNGIPTHISTKKATLGAQNANS